MDLILASTCFCALVWLDSSTASPAWVPTGIRHRGQLRRDLCDKQRSNQVLLKSVYRINLCVRAQLCPTLCHLCNPCNPMGCSPPGSTVHAILQARILEWVAMSSSSISSQPRDQTQVSCVSYKGSWVLYHGTTWEALVELIIKDRVDNKKN